MSSKCLVCGARVEDSVTSCLRCGTAIAPSRTEGRPVRKRLSIPFATIVAVGFAGALAVGSGRAASGHPAASNLVVSASVDGNPVQISGPAVALLQRKLTARNVRQGSLR